MMGLPGPYAGWGLTSAYLAGIVILWTAVIAALLALIRHFYAGHDPAPVSRQGGQPKQRKVA